MGLKILFLHVAKFVWDVGPFKGRMSIIRGLLWPMLVAPSLYGPKLRVHANDLTNIFALLGAYGDEIPALIRSLEPNDVFFDIGANTGVFSLIASETVMKGYVFAFEPNIRIFSDLCHNIVENRCANVIPLNVALSDRNELFALAASGSHSGVAGLRSPSSPTSLAGSDDTEFPVVAVTPEKLTAVSAIAKDRKIGMKIDVEGHEFSVLQGLRDAGLLKSTAWIVIEINAANLGRYGATVTDIYRLLKAEGFAATKGEGFSEHYDEIFSVR